VTADWTRLGALLPRYAGATPRYTSYPTAPVWGELGPEALRAELARLGGLGRERLALYVHVPFCRSLCHFCACNRVITRRPEPPEAWLETVLAELRAVRRAIGGEPEVTQLHWGGGTPTHLTPAQIRRLAGALGEAFAFAPDAERSVEIDPRVTTPEHLEALREHGFDRLSLGIQDFDARVQEAVHRIQPVEQVADLVGRARALGFGSVNFDLIYGLPFQTVGSFEGTLARVLELAPGPPDRVALYGYAHVTWVAKQQRGFGRHDLPSPEERLAIFAHALGRFTDAGYRYVGLDHFAKPDDELVRAADAGTLRRNFMGYTTQRGVDLVGLGPSAISEVGRLYAQSHRGLDAWAEAVARDGLATFRGHALSEDDEARRFAIQRIMCAEALRAEEMEGRFAGPPFAERWAPELRRLAPLARDGLVEIEADGSLRVTELGRVLVRQVASAFDAYLEGGVASQGREAGDDGRPRFSQGI